MKCGGMCCCGSMVFSLAVNASQRTTCFMDGPDPMCRTMWSTVHLRSCTAGSFQRLRLLDKFFGTIVADFACGLERVRWYYKVADVNIAGA